MHILITIASTTVYTQYCMQGRPSDVMASVLSAYPNVVDTPRRYSPYAFTSEGTYIRFTPITITPS